MYKDVEDPHLDAANVPHHPSRLTIGITLRVRANYAYSAYTYPRFIYNAEQAVQAVRNMRVYERSILPDGYGSPRVDSPIKHNTGKAEGPSFTRNPVTP